MGRRKYSLTPEHRSQLGPWRDRWIANAMSTEPMTEADRDACREAVIGLYAAAGLTPPKHIVFVPSPFVLAFAGGFAAARWHSFKTGFNQASATRSATRSATDSATRSATDSATRSATDSATYSATASATDSADRSNWYVVPADMREIARDLGVGDFGLRCAAGAWRMWQGGNQWSAWDSFLSFFKEVVGLNLPEYEAYQHWKVLAEHSGPRVVHPDFCMISDRPELLMVDAQNQPHGETGPFCRWRDGTALYSWHGTHVPANWIEQKSGLDPAEVLRATNVEQRAAGAAIIGWPKMMSNPALALKVIDDSGSPDIGQLIELTLPGLSRPGRFLKAECPRNGTICEGVPYVSDIAGLPIETALHAQAWRIGDPLADYQHPPART